jgi:hypothetical protein
MSINDSLAYDIGAICDSGDIGTEVEYNPVNDFVVTTHVVIDKDTAVSMDGMVRDTFMKAVIQLSDVTAPQAGDTFFDETAFKTYKVLEILEWHNAHVSVVIEEI